MCCFTQLWVKGAEVAQELRGFGCLSCDTGLFSQGAGSELSQGFDAHPLVLLRAPKGCWAVDCI